MTHSQVICLSSGERFCTNTAPSGPDCSLSDEKKKKKESSDELMQNGALVTINMNCAIYSVFFFFLIEEHFSALLSVAFPTSAFKNV